MRRVVVTGAGTVNALGPDLPSTWAALRQGRGAIGPLDIPGAERLGVRIGAQVRDAGWGNALPPARAARWDRFTRLAVVAAAEAVARAGLEPGALAGNRAGVVLGTGGGGAETLEDGYRALYADGRDRLPPLTVPRLMANAAACAVGMEHGLRGPTLTVSTACASSNHAIGLAFQMVRSGAADAMLAGGSDATLTLGGLKAWEGLRVLSPDGCRPFCRTRNGLVQGEGAAVLVLEERERAMARGADILAEVAGFGQTADAADLLLPSGEGAARAMREALEDAGLAPGDVGYVNAHGTGTAANDRVEAAALREVFGDGPGRPLVSSTKGLHGHAMGATGAIESLACLLALREGVVAPNGGWREADPLCDVDLVVGTARQARIGACLSNAFAFGGLNAVLAFRAA